MLECEMRQTVDDYLLSQGYNVAYECLISAWVDVVGCKWSERTGRKKPDLIEIVAIELKLKDIAGVIQQAKTNHHFVNESYAAMPIDFCKRMQAKTRDKFLNAGVGLIGVDVEDGTLEFLLGSQVKPQDYSDRTFANRLWSYYLRHRKDSI